MATLDVKRNYHMLDAELCMFTSNLCNFLTRDLADLSILGLTADMIEDLKDLGDDFEIFPPDATFSGDLMIATDNKNAIREQLTEIIRTMALRVETKWGANSGQYKRLNLGPIVRLTDDIFLVTSRDMQIKLTEYLPDLASLGLTQAMLDQWFALNNQFELARNEQADAVALRDEKTIERIGLGNEIYELVVRYCNFGKRIYEKTNPAKYNDYIIYTGTSPGSLTAPQNFMFDPVNYDFSWSAVEHATSYELQQSTDGVNWDEYWSGNATNCAYEEDPTDMRYFRVRARNAGGLGPASSVISYDFAPGLIAPTNLVYNPNTFYFTWNSVPNAEYYEFQYKEISHATWSSLNAGSATSFYHADPPGGYLARVRGAAGSTFGPWSTELSYSVGPIQPD